MSAEWALAKVSKTSLTAIACCSIMKRGAAKRMRCAAAMSHLAFLGIQHRYAGGLESDLPRLPGGRNRSPGAAGRNPSVGRQDQDLISAGPAWQIAATLPVLRISWSFPPDRFDIAWRAAPERHFCSAAAWWAQGCFYRYSLYNKHLENEQPRRAAIRSRKFFENSTLDHSSAESQNGPGGLTWPAFWPKTSLASID